MPSTYHMKAIEECREKLRAVMAQLQTGPVTITLDQDLLDRFIRSFETSFLFALTNQKAPSNTSEEQRQSFATTAWAMTRQQVFLKVDAIAALAYSYALEANRTSITEDDLKNAVHTVKPRCKTTTEPLKIAPPVADDSASPKGKRRLDYCGDWGWGG